MPDLPRLSAALDALGRVLLGYSGGVDSALLAVAGRHALGRQRFLAVIGRSASYPEEQYRAALATARQFDVPLREIETRELQDPRYLANPTNRCYFCKTELWTRLGAIAREEGFTALIDGTNADDLGEHRPGSAAGREHRVRSPLVELGWTKADVRAAARKLGIRGWDAPASPCLSSRVRYGLAITPERLAQVEMGEAALRAVGVTGDLRVRHRGTTASIEVRLDQIPLVEGHWPKIEARFYELGFERVEVDQRGYRRGSLLEPLPVLE
jgi:uncharacterized protein